MQDPESSEFLVRLREISRGRALTPWLATYGWSHSDVSKVIRGHIPGHLKLSALAAGENLSLTWLLNGVGPRYVGEGGWIAAEPAQLPPPRKGLRAELVARVDALPDHAIDPLLRIVRLMGEDGSAS